jgi:hypothetical protein
VQGCAGDTTQKLVAPRKAESWKVHHQSKTTYFLSGKPKNLEKFNIIPVFLVMDM